MKNFWNLKLIIEKQKFCLIHLQLIIQGKSKIKIREKILLPIKNKISEQWKYYCYDYFNNKKVELELFMHILGLWTDGISLNVHAWKTHYSD